MALSKNAARIIKDVEKLRMNYSPQSDLENAGLYLRVTTLSDEDPGIRYSLRNENTHEPVIGAEGNLAVVGHNPLFFKHHLRKAEGIANEVWTYYTSSGLPCHVSHYSGSLI